MSGSMRSGVVRSSDSGAGRHHERSTTPDQGRTGSYDPWKSGRRASYRAR